jgi:hypothetical protein
MPCQQWSQLEEAALVEMLASRHAKTFVKAQHRLIL